MKDQNWITAVLVCILLAAAAVVYYAEAEAIRQDRIEDATDILERTAQYMGVKSLGVIDPYEVSKKTGYAYYEPVILKALFERNGLQSPGVNTWTWHVDWQRGVEIRKVVVYETDPLDNRFANEVATYLYGEIGL